MRLLASLLITASLIVGIVAAVTAYVPRLDVVAQSTQTLTLNAPAGIDPEDEDKPLVAPTEDEEVKLTSELIEQLEDQDVNRVRVKEFAWSRWDGRWWFILACAGLIGGAVLIRRQAKKSIQASAIHVEKAAEDRSPRAALQGAIAKVEALRADIYATDDLEKRRDLFVERLGAVQRQYLDAFVDRRDFVIAHLGMSGYAQLMDHFASAERQLYRAWSAAADHVLDEAELSLDRGLVYLRQTLQRLDQQGG